MEARFAKVTWAENGKVALDLVQADIDAAPAKNTYDMILMDLQMPEMDGFESCQKIRKFSEYAQTPILALTAHAIQEELEKCKIVGMQDRITKPIDLDIMLATIKKHLITNEPAEDVPMKKNLVKAETVIANKQQTPYDNLPGFKSDHLLKIIGGNTEMMHVLLQQFVDLLIETQSELQKALKNKENVAATNILHKLNGAAGNSGATDIFELARQGEQLVKSDEIVAAEKIVNDLFSLNAAFIQSWETLPGGADPETPKTSEISGNLPTEDQAKKQNFDAHALSEISHILHNLADHLEKNDLSAAKVAHHLQDQLNGSYAQEISKIMQKIDNLDYGMALDGVHKMLDDFQDHQIKE